MNKQLPGWPAQTSITNTRNIQWRAIEFFAGIGGFACACPEIDVAMAVDIDADAKRVYQLNWPHEYKLLEISSLETGWIDSLNANLWWMSPPCQPYSRRGRQQDLADPRSAGLMRLIELLHQVDRQQRPAAIALENVVGFASSQAHQRLHQTLLDCGYYVAEKQLCPTELGWPNRRPRFYMLATRHAPVAWRDYGDADRATKQSLPGLIAGIAFDRGQCAVELDSIERFQSAMHRVDVDNPEAITACFGSSYGKSLLHAGSYIIEADGNYRRLAPQEVARLLGFPASIVLPEDLSYRRQWKLLGNSLSIPVVRYVMSHLPAAQSLLGWC